MMQGHMCDGSPIPVELIDVPVLATDVEAVAWALAHVGVACRSMETGDFFEVEG